MSRPRLSISLRSLLRDSRIAFSTVPQDDETKSSISLKVYTDYIDWTRGEEELLYAITDRRLYAGKNDDARARIVELAAIWAANNVSYIQIREKDLPAREQVELTRAVIRAARSVNGENSSPRILVNGRVDVALAADADGVHLPSGPDALSPKEVRFIFAAAGQSQPPTVSVSCHTMEEVLLARQQKADCILFAPVFEKVIRAEVVVDMGETDGGGARLPGTGLELLKRACRAAADIPVFALGGVTVENAADCLNAGAAGMAAIRLFQQSPSGWKHLV